ncbi:MAG: hypothetical protein J0M19_15000, partial [Sphingomonadales bacterium]|nr:hypothetical protein [Sphingomonadales bacterium]
MGKASGKLILALALLAAPLAAAPDAVRGHIEQARSALARGDGIAAKADLDRAIQAGATRTDISADMGEAFILQGESVKAREWLGPGQFAKGQEGRGWRLLGNLERSEWRLAESGKALDRALAFSPRDPLLWIEIGRLRYQGGEQLQAIEAADRAVAAAPDHPRAIEFRARLLRDSHGDAAALPLIERGLAKSPDDLALLGSYAASLGELGRAHDMLLVTRKMLSIDPANAQAFFLQAALAARAGNVDLARAMLNRAGNRLNDVPAATLLKAILELEAGNANVAAQPLIALADWQEANPRLQALLARSLYEAGDTQQLFARYGALAQRGDTSPYLLTILGRALEEQGKYAEAAVLLDRAVAGMS